MIDDGEFGKPSFVSYVNERLAGFEVDPQPPRQGPWAGSREARSFPEFYAQASSAARPNRMMCTAPGTVMRRSSERIITTHAGSLPRPADLLDAAAADQQGKPGR